MGLHSPRRTLVSLLAVVLFTCLSAGSSQAKGKGKQIYYYLVHDIKLPEGTPKQVADMVRKQIVKSIAAHERLIEALPEGAPDPDSNAKAFIRYKKKNKLHPFRVNVDVTEYSHKVDKLPAPRRGQRLTVSISLHIFGETIPERVMGFTGEGSATIKMDIGKNLRPRDTKVANHDAIELAVGDALTTSLIKLDTKSKKKKRSRRKKK